MLSKAKATLLGASMLAGVAGHALAATPLITGTIDDRATLTLAGEHAPAIATARDLGALADAATLPHVMMGLKRSPEMQAALDQLVAAQQAQGSPSYHRWLKAAELRQYGPAQADIDKTVAWLHAHGLTVNSVSPSGMAIDFGGTAAQIAAAFHTSLHNVSAAGEMHVANMADPAIPAALAPVVRGVTLSNFFPRPDMARVKPNFTIPYSPDKIYAVAPADFATIYNINPLRGSGNFYGQPITGAGVTLTVVEQTDINPADWNTFRTSFGLSTYAGTLTLTHPSCTDPGFTGDEGEAALDAEWSSVAGPDTAIVEASCPATATTFGVMTTLQGLVEGGTTSTIFSISYGGAEAANGFTFLQMWSNLIEEGAAEGISIFVSTGDSGSSSEQTITNAGLAVNGLASNIYDTAVGGTDFYDFALGKTGAYWTNANGAFASSAKSYIPEVPWDNACSNSIIWKYAGATDGTTYCNSSASAGLQNGVGGGGGESIFYAKPSWQQVGVPGMLNDGVRDLPDVSLFAANGVWNHFYVFCMSDANEGGSSCNYHSLNDIFGNAAGGTSFSAPAFAGITALINQVHGGGVGNAAPRLYQIAQAQYTNPLTLRQCNSTLGKKISTACVFNDVTAGDNTEPCVTGSANCASTSASTSGIGILAARKANQPLLAFPATSGYDLATGLGTVNVTNLLYNY